MSTISVYLPDGSSKELEAGATVADCAAAIGTGLAKAAIAGKIDGELVGLDAPLADGAQVEIVTKTSPEGLGILQPLDGAHHGRGRAGALPRSPDCLWPANR